MTLSPAPAPAPARIETARVETALAGLDFRGRIGQLNQRLFGWQAVERTAGGFRLTDLARREIDRWGGLGALYGLFRADAWSGRSWADGIRPDERAEVAALVQQQVYAAGGIGVLLSEEAPHGHQALGASVLPSASSSAASFDPDLVEQASAAVAAQLAASGAHLGLVSTLDLLRDPRWGRAEECFGEDPHLASLYTTAVVHGMQGRDRDRLGAGGVGVVLKHLAAQGEASGGRNGQSSVIGPRDLAELHVPMVRAGVAAGAVSMMAAYNDIDGVPCCANPALLRTLLRTELGFDGVVMADGLAVDRLDALTGDPAASGRLALLSGVDLSLWDEGFTRLEQWADDPDVVAAVEQACRRVLNLKDRFGLLTPEPGTGDPGALRAAITAGEHLSARLAAAALVLLADPADALPLQGGAPRRVLVAGPFADDATALLGDYVAPLQPPAPGIGAALVDALPDAVVHVTTETDDAEHLAQFCDAVVLVLGGSSHRPYHAEFADNGALRGQSSATCGEGVDLASIDLPPAQLDLLGRVVAAAGGPVVAVVVAGRPHVLTPLHDAGVAVLWAGYPGPHGGAAVADALLGRRAPTGRLPFTLPAHSGVVPVRHNDRHDADGVYRDAPRAVLHPFGAGLTPGEPRATGVHAEPGPDGVALTVGLHNPHPDQRTAVIAVFVRRGGGSVLPRRRELVALLRRDVGADTSTDAHLDLPWSAIAAPDAAPGARTDIWVDAHHTTVELPARPSDRHGHPAVLEEENRP